MGSKHSNANNPKVPVDDSRTPWYTFGVGTTTADAHHHAAEGATTRVLGRTVSGRRARRGAAVAALTTAPSLWPLLVPWLVATALGFTIGSAVGYLRSRWAARRGVLALLERLSVGRPERRIDVVRCWRFANRLGLRTTALRFVSITDPAEDGYGHSGTAYIDGGFAEINLQVVHSEAEAVVTAVHELVHLTRDNGRHDKAFFDELSKVWRRIGAPTSGRQFVDAASIASLEAEVDLWVGVKLRSMPPTKVRWVRRARPAPR